MRPDFTDPVVALFVRRCHAAWTENREWADELEQRALAVAGDLATGTETNLYVIWEPCADAVKIGIGRDPKGRLAMLQIGSPSRLFLVCSAPATSTLERFIHGQLDDARMRGEWFHTTPRVLATCEYLLSAADIAEDITASGDPVLPEDAAAMFCGVDWEQAA